MKLALKSVRLKDSTTLCGKPGTVFVAGESGLALTADTDAEAVIFERPGTIHDAVFVPMGNVAHYTPAAQKPKAVK